ncbi:MAG: hypothetical protein V4681_01770 [Patescibacteria group bacterium]
MHPENPQKVTEVFERLKRETGDDWEKIKGTFSFAPHTVYRETVRYTPISDVNPQPFYQYKKSLKEESEREYPIAVKLFRNTRTEEIRTILASSLV